MNWNEARKQAQKVVQTLSPAQKAVLCVGADYWQSEPLPQHNLDGIVFSDGPHGLRRQEKDADYTGLHPSRPATCYPSASAAACSFDPALMKKIGEALAQEAACQGVDVILGPGINHKRTPWCGRNFEYFSEDPLLSGILAAGMVEGIQENGTQACLKHLACNNQENYRMTSNSLVDERAYHELYLRPFLETLKQVQPGWIMTSYNRINGVYATQKKPLMDEMRKAGFQGGFISDWGSLNDPLASLEAGMDLEMPGLSKGTEQAALKLSGQRLDELAEHIVTAMILADQPRPRESDPDKWRQLALEAARQSGVLLKNEEQILPVQPEESLAVIGWMARCPRFQGAGSSKVNPRRTDSLMDVLNQENRQVSYAQGVNEDGSTSPELLREARAAAAGAEKVILVLGLPEIYESEGFDRDHLQLPQGQLKLVEKIAEVNSNIIVVLQTGSVVELPVLPKLKGLLLMYLAGEQTSQASWDLLTGRVNPSGRLAETWIRQESQVPVIREEKEVYYKESIFSGYRYYDTADLPVNFPFGYGLSYTDFVWNPPEVRDEGDRLEISLKVKNTGLQTGSDVIQIYGGLKNSGVLIPSHQLLGFQKVTLEPGQETEIQISVPADRLAYYDRNTCRFENAGGIWVLEIARSSRDILFTREIRREGRSVPDDYFDYGDLRQLKQLDLEIFKKRLPEMPEDASKDQIHLNTTIEEIRRHNRIYNWIFSIIIGRVLAGEDNPVSRKILERTIAQMPVRLLGMYGLSKTQVDAVVDLLNGRFFSAIKKALQRQGVS